MPSATFFDVSPTPHAIFNITELTNIVILADDYDVIDLFWTSQRLYKEKQTV